VSEGKTIEENKKYWLGLKLNPVLRNRIYITADMLGGPKGLWHAGKKNLIEIGFPENLASEAVEFNASLDLEAEYNKVTEKGISILTDDEESFPEILRQTPGHPRSVFAKGKLADYETAVGIVGARRCTTYGKAVAYELAEELAKEGIIIVSGAARGIDTAAHHGALAAGGITYAVLGCGLDIVYPPENRNLLRDIEKSGAVISEYPPGTQPFPRNFPARNRIVAGMVKAIIVVEAGEKSGALITADFALEYGRDVFAVPGRSKSATSKGTNMLIKQGAYLLDGADDVLEVMGIDRQSKQDNLTLNNEEKALLEIIGWEAKRVDQLMQQANTNASSISARLLSLEIEGFIKRDLAGNYIRIR